MSDLTTIKIYSNRMMAEADKQLLENYNIKSIVLADDCGGAYPSMAFDIGVKLLINKKDQKKTSKILEIDNK